MMSFVKVMFSIAHATNAANLHLKTVNAHMEDLDYIQFNTEALPFRDEHSFHGVSSRGWGGVNTHIIQWSGCDAGIVRLDKLEQKNGPIAFWPAGGGMLEREARPSEGYFIVGSFNSWQPEEMSPAGGGSLSYTVTLGMNRYETFQIWLDGDSNRVLHPGRPQAPSAMAVKGPVLLDQAHGNNWLIDGRTVRCPTEPALEDSASDDKKEALAEYVEVSTRDRGRVGDQYEVMLNIAGRYRAVSWRKMRDGAPDDELRALQGTYYVTGTLNDWKLEEMTLDEDLALGLHTLKVGPLPKDNCEFQIVRNRDWDQRFHPVFSTIAAESWDEYEVEGPDGQGHGKNWYLKSKRGDYFIIEFQRAMGNGVDMKRIAWRRLPKEDA